ncbi:hypothetical protein NGM33_28785 [Nocardiopsis dassonvillei]|uniref:hypothetical protein n=1 Tax=Nocardiopsis dassonvillei TaxID=2014 RepID=UPI0020A27B9D|nr:hypothetical protein [Nocardiopsis dassonvillei]MCP3017334.1 hypothetical protein [Nocardiopsis dassonvillei]
MSIRRATVWVIACDAPDCLKLAIPASLRAEQHEKNRRALYLADTVDAFTTAEQNGWVTDGWPDFHLYCPDHAHVPESPRPIRESTSPEVLEPASASLPAPADRSVVDVPLPGMTAPADR